jgi:excisionase family DNA binding protein
MEKLSDRFIFVAEAAHLLKLTPQWVKKLVDEGQLSAHRIGPRGVRLIDRRSVERLLEQRRQAAAGNRPAGGDQS